MNTRFYNARILTLENALPVTGEVWIEDDKITLVGTPTNIHPVWNRQIDCKNNLLTTGFKNAHAHTAMTFLRSLADDLPLSEWLDKKVFPAEKLLTPDDVYWSSILGIMEYLSSGITSAFDMYFFQRHVIQAFIDTGFRGVFTSGANSIVSNSSTVFDVLYNQYESWNKLSDRITYKLGFHAEYTTSEDMLKEIVRLSRVLKRGVYTHVAETKSECDACFVRHKKTPVSYLSDLGMWEYGGGAFHSIHISDDEIDILKRYNVGIVTNPSCNAKLASGVAPIMKFIAKGLTVAIGTDGAASNNSLDMFKEMFLCSVLTKLVNNDAAALPAFDVLKMATLNSAAVMQLPECDTVAVDKKADIILIDCNQPDMQPENNLVANLVYSANKQNVLLTMVNGKILYENGNYDIGYSPSEVFSKVRRTINRIKDAL